MKCQAMQSFQLLLFFATLRLCGAVSEIVQHGHQDQGTHTSLRIHAKRQQQTDKTRLLYKEEDLPTGLDFKMPKVSYADRVAAWTDGFLDLFVLCYWGTILVFIAISELVGHFRGRAAQLRPSATSLSASMSVDRIRALRKSQLQENIPATPAAGRTKGGKVDDDEDDPDDKLDLSPNFWTFNVVAARGLAYDKKGDSLSPAIVCLGAILMGLLQLFTLFLIVYDIDPAAAPYTQKPAAAWKESPLTVNCMKVCMTFFLGMSVVAEAGDAYDEFIIGMSVKDLEVSRVRVVAIPLFHYTITLAVVVAGVSVVLSCQAVPDILFNSMAVLFITQVDELFWGFFERTFDVDAQWYVKRENLGKVAESELMKRCIIMFPMMWGFSLLGRAWYRNQMPMMAMRMMAKG
jgi:hypothetical protein